MKKLIAILLVVITLISMLTIGAVGVNASNYSLSISQNLSVSSKGLTSSWSCKSAPTDTKYWLYWNKVGARGWNKEYVGTSTSYTIPSKKLQSGVQYKVQVLDFDTSVRKSGRISKVYSYTYLENVKINRTVFVGSKLYIDYSGSKGANAYQVAYKKYGSKGKYTYMTFDKWETRTTSNQGKECYVSIVLPSKLSANDIHVQVRPVLKTKSSGTAYGAYSVTKWAKNPSVNMGKSTKELENEVRASLKRKLKNEKYSANMVAVFMTAVDYKTGFRPEYIFGVVSLSSANSESDIIYRDTYAGMLAVSVDWYDDFLTTDWQASVDAQVNYLVEKLNVLTNWQDYSSDARKCFNCIMTEALKSDYYQYDDKIEKKLIEYGGTINPPIGYEL